MPMCTHNTSCYKNAKETNHLCVTCKLYSHLARWSEGVGQHCDYCMVWRQACHGVLTTIWHRQGAEWYHDS